MWYVLQVRAGTEENIQCQCQSLISETVLERCFIPCYQEKKKIRGNWQILQKKLFPGYIFLITDHILELIEQLKKINGFTQVLRLGDELIPLTQEEINLLLRMGGDDHLVEMSIGIIENDQVIITSGPLAGLEGCIRRIDRHKRKAWLEIEMFGRLVEMQAGIEILKKNEGGRDGDKNTNKHTGKNTSNKNTA